MFDLLKSRTSIDIFRTEKCKSTYGLKFILIYRSQHTERISAILLFRAMVGGMV